MPRVFVGLGLPDALADHLALLGGGIRGARWEAREDLHLTLRFVGDAYGERLRALEGALDSVRAAPFELELRGVGVFPPRGDPRTLWVGVADDRELVELQRKIERALVREGFEPEPRKFFPHVTLARMRDAPRDRVAAFLAHHGLFSAAPFVVDAFVLYSSTLGASAGMRYRVQARYELSRDRTDAQSR